MTGLNADLAAIRERMQRGRSFAVISAAEAQQAFDDRAALLAVIDRLTADRAEPDFSPARSCTCYETRGTLCAFHEESDG